MTRKNRSLLIAVIFLLLAGGALIVVKTAGRKNQEKPEEPARTLTLSNMAAADIRSAVLEQAPGTTLNFSSTNGEEWQMDGVPEYFRVKKSAVFSLIVQLARMDSLTMAASKEDKPNLQDFGFQPPQATVTLTDKDGHATVVELGAKSPGGSGYFARNAGSTDIAIIPEATARLILSRPDSFRDMSLPVVQTDKLTGLSLRHGDKLFIAEPAQGESPFATFPHTLDIVAPFHGRYPLDNALLANMLKEEHPLPTEVAEYRDSLSPDNPELGLNSDTADTLFLVDSEGGRLFLIMGAPDGAGRRYAMLGDRQDAVFLLKEKDVSLLTVNPFELMSKFVFLGSITKMSRIKVEDGQDVWILERTESGEPENVDDDIFTINGSTVEPGDFKALYGKFIGIMWEGEASKTVSLQKPDIRITVSHVNPGVEKTVIRFWPYDDVYYQVNEGNQPLEFLAGKYQVERFLEELRALDNLAG